MDEQEDTLLAEEEQEIADKEPSIEQVATISLNEIVQDVDVRKSQIVQDVDVRRSQIVQDVVRKSQSVQDEVVRKSQSMQDEVVRKSQIGGSALEDQIIVPSSHKMSAVDEDEEDEKGSKQASKAGEEIPAEELEEIPEGKAEEESEEQTRPAEEEETKVMEEPERYGDVKEGMSVHESEQGQLKEDDMENVPETEEYEVTVTAEHGGADIIPERDVSFKSILSRRESILGKATSSREDMQGLKEIMEETDQGEVVTDMQDRKIQWNRDKLIARFHSATAQNESLRKSNSAVQNKLAEFFRRPPAVEKSERDRITANKIFQDYISEFTKLQNLETMRNRSYQMELAELKMCCKEKTEMCEIELKKLLEFEKNNVLTAESPSRKTIPAKEIDKYMKAYSTKEQEVSKVRLENLKLMEKVRKIQKLISAKEELTEGLFLKDFEQLKVENQTYNERVEERNEELFRLKRKTASTVQILTHYKEKLNFFELENQEHQNALKEVESSVAKSREILTRTKQARDSLKIDIKNMTLNSGLLSSLSLLKDFHNNRDIIDELRTKLEKMQNKHKELTSVCDKLVRSIDNARKYLESKHWTF